MKKYILLGITCTFILTGATSAFAGEMKQDDNGSYWLNDDGSYPVSCWEWLDKNGDGISECYYFDENGYLVTNAVIDERTVNEDGAWTVDGLLQTREDSAATDTVSQYSFTDVTPFFTTDLQYFEKATELCPEDWINWYHHTGSDYLDENGQPHNRMDDFYIGHLNPSYSIHYDSEQSDHRVTYITGWIYNLMDGLEKDTYCTDESFTEILKEAGATDIQITHKVTWVESANIVGGQIIFSSEKNVKVTTGHLEFQYNGLKYTANLTYAYDSRLVLPIVEIREN